MTNHFGGTIKILLIDDHAEDIFLIREYLDEIPSYSVELSIAKNYQSGWENLQQDEWDLCFLDFQIEGDRGLEFIRAAIAEGIRTPIVMMSRQGTQKMAVDALKSGAYDFQDKHNLEPTLLEQTIRHALDQKDSSDLLRENRERYATLFRRSTDGIFFCDKDLRVVKENEVFQSLFGGGSKEGLSVTELFHKTEEYESFNAEIAQNGRITNFKCSLKGNGPRHICRLSLIPLEEASPGSPRAFMGIVHDVTSLMEAQRKIQLAARMSMTGRMARVIGHEIRNPLTNINLALQQLEQELAPESEYGPQLLELVKRNTLRIETLIRELLNSARPLEADQGPCSLNEVLDGAISLARDRIELAGVKLKRESDPGLPEIVCDSEKIKIVLLNLIINAVEAMEGAENKYLHLSSRLEGEEIVLEVKDTGIGMDEETLEMIFEPYFTGKRNGTGLGLTAVRNIVLAHQGDIEVESEPGQGSSFLVHLPLNQASNFDRKVK